MVEQWVRNNVNFTLVLHMLNFLSSTFPCLNSTLFCLSISSLSVRTSVIMCPNYLILLVSASGVDPILNAGTCTTFSNWYLQHITALFKQLYFTSWLTPNSLHISSRPWSPRLDGEIRTKSSAYIRWLTVFPSIQQPVTHLFNFTLSSSMYTLNK